MHTTKRIRIKDRWIGADEPVFLTAEIGSAHQGDFERCKILMKAARDAGCDGSDIFMADEATYIHHDGPVGTEGDSYVQILRDYDFTDEQWKALMDYADDIGLILYLTPLGVGAIERALTAGAPMLNINSDEVNDRLFLERIARAGVPLTMHDINATLGEVEAAVSTLIENGCKDLIVLHSTLETGDPNLMFDGANLRVMDTYRRAFGERGVLTGCVEHTTSRVLIYAVAAREPVLISKHLLYERAEGVPDSSISLECSEMAEIVRNVRQMERALGGGVNIVICEEDGSLPAGNRWRRKVLVPDRAIKAGERVSRGDFLAKRPGDQGGLHPWYADVLDGARARIDLPRNTILDLNMFEDFGSPAYRPYELERRRYQGRYTGP